MLGAVVGAVEVSSPELEYSLSSENGSRSSDHRHPPSSPCSLTGSSCRRVIRRNGHARRQTGAYSPGLLRRLGGCDPKDVEQVVVFVPGCEQERALETIVWPALWGTPAAVSPAYAWGRERAAVQCSRAGRVEDDGFAGAGHGVSRGGWYDCTLGGEEVKVLSRYDI